MLGEVLTAIVTPFRRTARSTSTRFRALARHLVDHGSDGLVVTGTTGEAPTLSDDERFELYAAAVEEVGDRATVVAGTGTYSTAHSVHLTEQAHELGVDALPVVTPYYNKPPQRGIVAHFQAIAAAPTSRSSSTTSRAASSSTSSRRRSRELAEIPNVTRGQAGEPRPAAGAGIVELGLDLYAGDDDLILPVPRARRRRRRLRPHPRRRAAGEGADPALPQAGDAERRGALDRELAPRVSTSSRSRRTRSRSRRR